MLPHETLHTEPNLRLTISHIFEILYGGLGYRHVRPLLQYISRNTISDLFYVKWCWEKVIGMLLGVADGDANVSHSREFCCVYVCSSNPSYASGSAECSYWASSAYSFLLSTLNIPRTELCWLRSYLTKNWVTWADSDVRYV